MAKFRSILLLVLIFSAVGFSAVQKPDPAEAARLNNLGVALLNQQRMDKALEKFDAALRTDPSLTTAALNKGITLLNLQRLPEAEGVLKQVVSDRPADPRAWCNLGLLNRSLGKYQEAIEDFKKVVAIDPTDADSYYLMGSLYLQLQQYDAAITAFETALKIYPIHASAEFGLARALQRSGKVDLAREHLHTFEHLTHDKISSAMTLAYGEQGKYSIAEDVHTDEPQVGAMIPVTFDVAAVKSLTMPAKDTGPSDAAGGGMCMLDVNGDGKTDLVVVGQEPPVRVFLNQGAGRFTEGSAEMFAGREGDKAVSCAVGDFDNDERPDVAIAYTDHLALFRNMGGGKFEDVTKSAGLQGLNHPAGITFVDYDHDGDLDLFVTGSMSRGASNHGPSAANVVWRNNGNGTFTEWTGSTGMQGVGSTTSAVLTDLDNDRAVDLLVTGDGAPTIFINQREKFAVSPLYTEKLAPTVGVYVFDFNKDGWMDVVLTHAGAPGISLWKNVDGKRFERVPLPLDDVQRGWGVTAVDFDNDGWIDIAAVVETKRGSEVRVLRNMGSAGFADVSKALGLEKVQLQNGRGIVAADVDGDGDSDLIVSQLAGAPVVLRNDGGNRNHALRIVLKGLGDNRSGIGTKVEVFSDGLWQKWEAIGAAGYLSQGPNEILAGIGDRTSVDIVRMLWPTGVLQDETEVALDKPEVFAEIDRRGSSCPTLFAWDGSKYGFISDVIGAAVIGHWISPNETNIADPDEWTKIEGSQLKARNGKFSLRFGEPMEEVNFIDKVRLVAVDHPASAEVYPDERFMSAPPFASGNVVITGKPHIPMGAWDDAGHDVRELLSTRDHRFVQDFKNLSYAGYANMHGLTLDIGEWSVGKPLRLFLDGFIEYFTANSMYAAWQAGILPVAPYVEEQLPNGDWKRVIEDMGFPAGLPRMITVDLTGKLSPGTRRIRIVTNLQIYWDQILVDNTAPAVATRVTEMPLVSSDLEFRGYPQQVDGKTPGDLTYVYEKASQTGPFARERGNYTHYGDVTELLRQADDQYVIFGSGEDMDLEFDGASLPVLRKGWKRDYFFYANGFVKDMDFYETSPFTVADLPFHGMSSYPYPSREHYPDDAGAVRYRLEWNDRFDSGAARSRHYGFRYENRSQ